MSQAVKWKRLCLACGVVFESVRSDASFCGPRCRKRWERASDAEKAEIKRQIDWLKQGGMDSEAMVEIIIRRVLGGRKRTMNAAGLGSYA